MGYFFPFYLPNSPKNQSEISSFYICVPKIMVRRCTVPEICCVAGIIIFHFGPFCPFTPITAQKIKILKKWKNLLEISSFYICVTKIMIRKCTVPEICCTTDAINFHFGPFLSFYSHSSPKNQNFEKMKKTQGGIFILHICTKNYDQRYSSWDMVCDRLIVISHFGLYFALLPPPPP